MTTKRGHNVTGDELILQLYNCSSSTVESRFGHLTSFLTFGASLLDHARSVSARCWHDRLAQRLEPTPKL